MHSQLFLDTDEAVVLCNAVGAGGASCFDLACVGGNGQIGDEGVFSFTAAVRDDCCVAIALGEFDGLESFAHRTDLIELDENRVCSLSLNSASKKFGIGYEKIIAHELCLLAEGVGEFLPSVPVVFIETIFDTHDWIFLAKRSIDVDHLIGALLAALALKVVLAVAEEGARSNIECERNLIAEFVAAFLDRLAKKCKRLFG
jgi:hypothetical protein